MYKQIIICLFICTYALGAQNLVWEKKERYDFIKNSSSQVLIKTLKNYPFIDSNNNIINLFAGIENIMAHSCFYKIDHYGNVYDAVPIITAEMVTNNDTNLRLPLAITEYGNGYKVFCGVSNRKNLYGSNIKMLPMVITLDKDGHIISKSLPYDIDNSQNYKEFSINSGRSSNYYNSFYLDKYFYDLECISSKIMDEEHHVILSQFNTDGNLIWRKGIVSMDEPGNYYIAKTCLTNQGTIIIPLKVDVGEMSYMKILEVDSEGNIINEIKIENKNILYDAIKINSSKYIILGAYDNHDVNWMNFLLLMDGDGNIIKKTDIPHHNLETDINDMYSCDNNSFIITGRIKTDKLGNKPPFDILGHCYMAKMSTNFEYLWEFKSEKDTVYDMEFRNVVNPGGREFYVTGFKDRYNYYIAKFEDPTSSVVEYDTNLSLHPNPTTDIINISDDMRYNERVEMYTLEGVCVHSGRGRRIDVSHLAPGVYFVRVGAESLRFVKM
jgi:hypothetical protein